MAGSGRRSSAGVSRDKRFRRHSTHGVAIVPARLPAGDGAAEIQLQMWDFGGQDIYHGTHALFMRDNAIFALLWAKDFERRAQDESDVMIFGNQPLFYWVDYVRHLGGRDRAVTIVQTRCDRPGDEDICPVPETVIKEAFGRYGLVNFSSAKDRGRANLIEKLAESSAICASDRVSRRSASRDIASRRSSKPCAPPTPNCRSGQRRHRTLTQSEFRKICKEEKLKSEPEFLLDYLHRAGVVFYRAGHFQGPHHSRPELGSRRDLRRFSSNRELSPIAKVRRAFLPFAARSAGVARVTRGETRSCFST